MAEPLLATKTTVPRLREGRVARPRLVQRLRAATVREFVLVCAPAGFGKSTLLAEWVRGDRRPVAWLSLDEGDNDPVRFWRHVAAAMDAARARGWPNGRASWSATRRRRRSCLP